MTGPIGVFGGTFDPIHYGHLRTAFEMLQALAFSEVRFMPCGDPPHRGITFADAELRLRMVCAATAGQDGFAVDDRELRRDGPSYSIDTLASLRLGFATTGQQDNTLDVMTFCSIDECLDRIRRARHRQIRGIADIGSFHAVQAFIPVCFIVPVEGRDRRP